MRLFDGAGEKPRYVVSHFLDFKMRLFLSLFEATPCATISARQIQTEIIIGGRTSPAFHVQHQVPLMKKLVSSANAVYGAAR